MMALAKMSTGDILMCGSLQKRSQNKGHITAENYRRRFFYLNKTCFKYFDGTFEVFLVQLFIICGYIVSFHNFLLYNCLLYDQNG